MGLAFLNFGETGSNAVRLAASPSLKKHFRALIYLHRYDKDTVNRLLNGYLREFRHKLTHRHDELR